MTQNPKATAKANDKVLPAASLSELCSEAAEHVARARLALFDENVGAESALLHLDEAIFCLKRLLARGRSSSSNGSHTRIQSA
jgi:hypothetical protein